MWIKKWIKEISSSIGVYTGCPHSGFFRPLLYFSIMVIRKRVLVLILGGIANQIYEHVPGLMILVNIAVCQLYVLDKNLWQINRETPLFKVRCQRKLWKFSVKWILRWEGRLVLSFEHFLSASDDLKYVAMSLMQKAVCLREGKRKRKGCKARFSS